MKNVEEYDYVFRCSFGFNVAVTRSELAYYMELKRLFRNNKIGIETYVNSQWQLLQHGWSVID